MLYKLFREVVVIGGLSRTCRQCNTYGWDVVQPMESPLWSDQCRDIPSPLCEWIPRAGGVRIAKP